MFSVLRGSARSTLLPAVLMVALTGCGSTVQQTSGVQSLPGGDGLSTAPAQGGLTGAGLGGSGSGGAGVQQGSAGGGIPSSPQQGTVPTAGPTLGSSPSQALSRVTTPISLGLLVTGSANGAASALGADYSTSTSGQDVAKALVRYYNKHGGMAGRRIQPVEYVLSATAGNYQTEMQAACTFFTQDHKVAAAISVLANSYFATYEQCLTKAGVPDFAGPTGTADEHDLAAFPGFVSVSAPSTNRRFTEMISRFVASGYLTPKNKVGVIVENCPYNDRAYSQTIAPLAKRAGLSLTRRDISCIHGFADAGAALAAFGGAVLPFRSAGVDRVMFISNFEHVGLFGFENQANSQGYAPSYALTSTTGGAALADLFSASQLPRMRGVGWTPVLDIGKRVLASPSTKRCRTMLASEGIRPQSKADDLLDIVCDQFFLLEATLQATRGHASRADLLGGLRSLRTGYVSAYTLLGATDWSSRRDGPRRFGIWGYSTRCSCMDYLSPPS